MSLRWDLPEDRFDRIAFYRPLKFQIDGVEMEEKIGELINRGGRFQASTGLHCRNFPTLDEAFAFTAENMVGFGEFSGHEKMKILETAKTLSPTHPPKPPKHVEKQGALRWLKMVLGAVVEKKRAV